MLKEVLLFCLVYIIIRSYLWYRRRIQVFKTFSKNGIKGPKPSLISGNFYELKDNPNDTLDEWIERYGNVFGYFIGDRPILVVNHLDTIQEILVKNSRLFRDRPKFGINVKPLVSSLLGLRGDRWRHVRRVITPSLAHNKITSKEITETVIESIDICIKNIEEQNEPVVRVEDRMQSITLDVVCKCVLNMYDTDVHKDNSRLKSAAKEYMDSAKNILVISAYFFPFIRPILAFINNYLTAGRMADLILKHLNKQIQIESQNIASNSQFSVQSNNVLKSLLKSFHEKHLQRDEVTGNALVLLLAGYDTTAMGLTSALYCLAKNADIQEKLRNEVNSEGYRNEFVKMVWNESLRLFPPVATFLQRESSVNTIINDIPIEEGTLVQVPVWHIHHDPNVWPQPYKFDPHRFDANYRFDSIFATFLFIQIPNHREGRHSAAFLAFGSGPRSCIGVELAALEARLTLSKIVEKFKIETCDQTPETIEFICPTDILYPKSPIYLRFVALNHN